MAVTKINSSLVAAAGEYFTLYKLNLNGFLAAPAPRGTPIADILILDPSATVVATLQVKARTYGSDGGWHMKRKHEDIIFSRLFYAFVDFEPDVPKTYIVPSSIVAQIVKKAHEAWLKTPGAHGQPHKDNDMRRIRPSYPNIPDYADNWIEKYAEDWNQLERFVQ